MNTVLVIMAAAATAVSSAVLPRGAPLGASQKFTATDVLYSSSMVYSTPAHLATYGGYIKFNLSNSATPFVTHCEGTGLHLQDFFYGEITYTCDPPAGATGSTNFTFSRPDNSFNIVQTWSADGINYQATGVQTTDDLECKTTEYQNQDWTPGQLYSTTNVDCEPATFDMPYTLTEV